MHFDYINKNTQGMVRRRRERARQRPAIIIMDAAQRTSRSPTHPHRASREDADSRIPEIRGMSRRFFLFFSKGHERASEGDDDAHGHAAGFEADSAVDCGAEWVCATARRGAGCGSWSGAAGRSTTCCSASSAASSTACRTTRARTTAELTSRRRSVSASNDGERKAMATHRQVAIAGLIPAADSCFRLTFDGRLGTDETVHTLL